MKRWLIWVVMMSCLWISGVVQAQDCEANPTTLPDYEPMDHLPFITIDDHQLVADDAPYPVYGINYYPSRTPWRRFLTETAMDDLMLEMEMMQDVGINTLRIFLWNHVLFQCAGTTSEPEVSGFERLDAMMQLAHEYDMRLLVTLNDLPDLTHFPLYDNPVHVQEQTRFIVNRYIDEPIILAWDLRNEGDIDYRVGTPFSRSQVLEWLRDTSNLVRSIDRNHLITAGWLDEAHSTAAYVDFISFHHWTSAEDLERRIRALELTSTKPILLQEVGYSTHRDLYSPQQQADILASIFQTTADHELLGWMVWTAFDFPIDATCYPSPCQSPDNLEHYFGIWTVDYVPKPAVAIVRDYAN